ncbi:hemopexin [Meleagris gallopavo]|uniref:hemopexin n=1 Tax=Meleagris gallopavo TaxID=9103 RepID=UPI00093A9840|nr:hemopexin [Meleagris gallopavo]
MSCTRTASTLHRNSLHDRRPRAQPCLNGADSQSERKTLCVRIRQNLQSRTPSPHTERPFTASQPSARLGNSREGLRESKGERGQNEGQKAAKWAAESRSERGCGRGKGISKRKAKGGAVRLRASRPGARLAAARSVLSIGLSAPSRRQSEPCRCREERRSTDGGRGSGSIFGRRCHLANASECPRCAPRARSAEPPGRRQRPERGWISEGWRWAGLAVGQCCGVARCSCPGGDVWEISWERPQPHSRPLAESWPELEGPVDAALRIHRRDHPEEHQSLYLFQGEKVWSYAGGQLRPNFPRRIGDEFPGVPGDLDAAVECHPEECGGETVLFFKGDKVFSFDLELRMTKERPWSKLGQCDAALRWLERYYCLQGTQFHQFKPHTGEVLPGYPRDLRDYFIPCPGRGEVPLGLSQGSAAL